MLDLYLLCMSSDLAVVIVPVFVGLFEMYFMYMGDFEMFSDAFYCFNVSVHWSFITS